MIRTRIRQAFSLIELLVTVVIILLLMAFILPRYFGGKTAAGRRIAAPRERAEAVAGVSYFQQINMAISMYRESNDGQNPPDLNALKKYGVTDEMLVDQVTRQPLTYDPQTGMVSSPASAPVAPRTTTN